MTGAAEAGVWMTNTTVTLSGATNVTGGAAAVPAAPAGLGEVLVVAGAPKMLVGMLGTALPAGGDPELVAGDAEADPPAPKIAVGMDGVLDAGDAGGDGDGDRS